ncbi:hypothetical protein L3N51_01955 [Metallosphaera sp. J1]|uniref:hypothetical protein n=1 Tax=Metallosphaera javensis (ex Hofmann et al. 2022) TaxID=99938 RepID=UPI001EDE6FD1|nr:hypothetical protein [Metallosphaera javensis (ex Hofmann et al. 2022)]MCG3109660.1 hypothetical protein [Metallosphaera javensis (ex Hofmann et al. 2022)]
MEDSTSVRYYSRFITDGLAKSLLDDISERTGKPKTAILEELGMSKGTPYKRLGEDSKEKILRKALSTLDPVEVLEEVANDLLALHSRLILEVALDLLLMGKERGKEALEEILNLEDYEEMLNRVRAQLEDVLSAQTKLMKQSAHA